MNLAIWSPRPSSPDGLVPLLPHLEALGTSVVWVSEDDAPRGLPQARPSDPIPADLHLFDVADHPSHAFAFRAARERPGVVLLRDASLPLLLADELSRPDSRKATLREMERAYGEDGVFVARLVARGLGGNVLPALFPLLDRVMDTTLALITLTEETRGRVARRLGDDRTLRLPIHLLASPDPHSPGEARRSLGIPADSPILGVAAPDSFRLSLLARVTARLRDEFPDLRLVVAAPPEPVPDALTVPDLGTMAAVADVVVALDPITPGGVPAGLAEAIAARRPLAVNAGSGAIADFSEGSVARVDPGRYEEPELEAVLRHLFRHPDLRATLGRLATEEARRAADPRKLGEALASFLTDIGTRKEAILRSLEDARMREAALLGLLAGEVEGAGRALGLRELDLGLPPLLGTLVRASR